MRILCIEDDPLLAEQISTALSDAGFSVDLSLDGREGEFLGATENYAGTILDLGLPQMDGLDVLKSWRAGGITMPVLILTARDTWADKVAGFRAGADDYVLKPFRMDEIVLRLQTLIRRAAGHATAEICSGSLCVDLTTGLATIEGMPLKLTAFEAKLLRYFMLHKGRIVTRTQLAEQMYDRDTDRDFRSLEVMIGRLRRKIGEGRIETRRGEGYRLVLGDTDAG